jgi:hypothetical protein
MLARVPEISKRWLVLGLTLHGFAAVLVLTNVLCSSSERRPAPPAATVPAGPRAPAGISDLAAPRAQREDASPSELRQRATDATEALAIALEDPEWEDARWRTAVEESARGLGSEALPALRALLADRERSVEQHVAATELVAALERE